MCATDIVYQLVSVLVCHPLKLLPSNSLHSLLQLERQFGERLLDRTRPSNHVSHHP
jgi:hypothetical protein